MIGELTGEGRTVFLSSHLLDEVEKTCDAAAVIDRGRIIAQGPITRARAGRAQRARHRLRRPPRRARPARRPPRGGDAYADARRHPVTLAGVDGVASINARLVTGGVLVSRLEPVRESLEQRFLEMTSRVGGQS